MENQKMTLFANVNSKRAERLVTLEEWIQQIRTNKTFAERVERRQKLLLKGRNDEADRIKRSLPALVPAGNCQNGRKVNLLTDRTGIAPFDFDHLEAERLEEVRQELPQYPWVKAVHRTCSLDGLRVFVNVGVMHPDVYPQAYRTVADWFRKELALAYDPACKDLCRLSFAASDPEAYYTARTEVFPYPDGFSPFGYQPPTGPRFLGGPSLSGAAAAGQLGRTGELFPEQLPAEASLRAGQTTHHPGADGTGGTLETPDSDRPGGAQEHGFPEPGTAPDEGVHGCPGMGVRALFGGSAFVLHEGSKGSKVHQWVPRPDRKRVSGG